MPDRKKVIALLERYVRIPNLAGAENYGAKIVDMPAPLITDAIALLKAQEPPTDTSISSAIECLLHPQDADDSDMAKAIDMAVRAMRSLKAQEPRVMALEEVKQWCEIHPHKQNPIWVEFQHGYGTNGWRVGLVNSGLLAWCKDNEARCWTSRPDEKRRAETPWN